MSATKYFIDPFAVAGDVTTIPNPPQSGGQVSYTTGFGFNYQRNLATDPLALPFPRAQFNQLMNDVTTVIQQIQQQGFPNWISTSDNGGSPFSYGLGAIVIYTNGFYYQSNISGNTNTPGDSSGAWQLIGVTQQGVTPVICDCASTTTLTLSGVQNIDGVTGTDGVTVVGYFSGTAAANGVYIMRSGAWTRSPYYNSVANIIAGGAIFVRAGTLNGNKYFQLVTAAPIVVGTTALTYSAPLATVANNSVTYAKIQQASANTLLGNPTGSLANVQEITLGTNLSFSGTVLNAEGITAGTAQTASGTEISFTDLPAEIKRIMITFDGVGATHNIEVQLSESSAFVTSGYISTYCAVSSIGAINANSTTGFLIGNGAIISGILTIVNIVGDDWVASFSGAETGASSAANIAGGNITGLGGALDGVRIIVDSSGTFSAGTLNIMYE